MYSLRTDIWNFIKNPIVLMFLFLFGFIQMIVILATINSNNLNSVSDVNRKSQPKTIQLDWRFKTAMKVDIQFQNTSLSQMNKTFDIPEIIQYGSEDYQYPLLVDMLDLVEKVKSGFNVTVEPINNIFYPYIIENENLCNPQNEVIDLLILIKSDPQNTNSRDVIRSTWGKLNCWGNRIVKRVFLFGNLSSINESDKLVHIKMEQEVYRDIVQSDFIDNYYNNTHKLMLAVNWATTHCRNAKFIMFVDDDYFVQPRAVLSYLESISAPLRNRLVSGYVWRMAVPQRNRQTKWFVSKEEYPWPFYPSYCSAGNFFISMNVAIDISIAMKYTKFLRFDDVFLGIVLHKLLIVPMHLSNVFSFNPIAKSSPSYHQIISSHGYKSSKQIIETWIDLNCSNFCV